MNWTIAKVSVLGTTMTLANLTYLVCFIFGVNTLNKIYKNKDRKKSVFLIL